MNSKIFNFLLENDKLDFEIECIVVKYPCCSLRFALEKLWKKFRGHESANGLGLRSRRLSCVPLAPNPGDAADNHLFLHLHFSVVFYVMRSKNLQKWRR